jgi:hypothetical protein
MDEQRATIHHLTTDELQAIHTLMAQGMAESDALVAVVQRRPPVYAIVAFLGGWTIQRNGVTGEYQVFTSPDAAQRHLDQLCTNPGQPGQSWLPPHPSWPID